MNGTTIGIFDPDAAYPRALWSPSRCRAPQNEWRSVMEKWIGRILSHYKVVGPIGTGGMGEVYLAEDTRLGRNVALKVLRADAASDRAHRARFELEAKALAALNHPNIVTIYSIEEESGLRFITMEFVEGKTLDQIIPTGGFEPSRFCDIAIPLADALAAAHERGIAHRDLKPANVMVDAGGRVKVLDFGLAKLLHPSRQDSQESFSATLTQEGFVVGTLAYMPPEQLEGRTPDARTDLFSLGVLLYEMATGTRPFNGSTAVALASSILKDTPVPLGERRPGWPQALERIVAGCLEKNPVDRLQSARQIHAELLQASLEMENRTVTDAADDRSFTARVEVRSGELVRLPRGPSIAVLPFRNLSDDPNQQYFADGLTEDLIDGLSRYRWFFVIARNSSFAYKSRVADSRQVAQDLGVRYVLEGSVRKSGNRIRLSAQLVEAASGRNIWSERYDRELRDLFTVQDELVATIAGAIEPAMGRAERERVIEKRPESLDAWDLYQRGVSYLHRRTKEDLSAALRFFASALELEPTFVPALAASAEVCFFQTVDGWTNSQEDSAAVGLRFARRALELDPSDASAHYALGRIYTVLRQPDQAIPELEKAVELNPSSAWAHYALGMAYGTSGQPERAIGSIEAAMRLSPHDPYRGQFMVRMGEAMLFMGRHEEALVWAQRSLREPNVQWSRHALHASILGHLGRVDEAREALRELCVSRPDASLAAITAWWPISDAGGREHLLEGLRKAGLSEAS